MKYKTSKVVVTENNERFDLKYHAAQDYGRYDFLTDMVKLEDMRNNEHDFQSGYCVLLTNDHLYWDGSKRKEYASKQFEIKDSEILKGTRVWEKIDLGKITKCRRKAIELTNEYKVHWLLFDNSLKEKGFDSGLFKYLVVEIKNDVIHYVV